MALADKVIGAAVENMQVHGFINYYGLQRFGTYAVGTHDVGIKILQGDFEGAVNANFDLWRRCSCLCFGPELRSCRSESRFQETT